MDTDEETLKANKKHCINDLRKGINEFLSGNPQALIKNLNPAIFCGHAGSLRTITANSQLDTTKEKTDQDSSSSEENGEPGSKGYFS